MTKLDEILNNNFNLGFARITTGQARRQIKDLILEMIGDNDPEWVAEGGRRKYLPKEAGKNLVRQELRKQVEEL